MSVTTTWNDVEQATDRSTTRTVSIARFLKVDERAHNEYVRVFVDREKRQIRVYRPVGEQDETRYWRVVIDDVSIKLRGSENEPTRFDLHGFEACNFLSWLETLKNVRGDVRKSFTWSKTNNAAIHEQAGLDCESIFLEWDNDNRDFLISIDDNYKNETQMMATFDR